MRTTLLRLFTLSMLVAPSVTHAYYLEERGEGAEPLRFADGDTASAGTIDVAYRINTSSFPPELTGGEEAIEAAFDTWTAAECASIAFTEGPTTDTTDRRHWMTDGGEIYVAVYFTASDEEWIGGPAVGHFHFGYDPTGVLIGASIALNSRDHAWATDGAAHALDVQSIVTALIGRALGITSAMEGNATYPRYAPGDLSKRELGEDDLAAIAYLYPVSGGTCTAPPEPEAICDGFTPECPPRPMTTPGDAGTILPGDDAGTIGRDAGTPSGDAGTDTTGGGGCSVGAARSDGALAWCLAALALATLRRPR
ncbi:MAG: hypothetical protein M5U28_37180 [Sandaracinaceae bacterium]|nr:hypothetical protein [Sandaracinaceae bacterium]